MKLYCLGWVPGGIPEHPERCLVEVYESGYLGGKLSHQCYGLKVSGDRGLCGPHLYDVSQGKEVVIPKNVGEVGGVFLRKARESDCEFFYEMRSDPVASRMSRRPVVSREDHLKWWDTTQDLRLVAECDLVRVGTIRVAPDGVVSIIVHPEFRGMNLGTRMLQALDNVARNAGFTHLIAEIAYENAPSQSIFLKAGWKPVLMERFL